MHIQKERSVLDNPLNDYEQLLHLSRRMQMLSRQGNWSELIEKQTVYVAQMERLALLDKTADDRLSRRCAWIVDQLVEHSEEIRARLISRRDEIGQLISSANQGNSALLYDH